MVLRSSSRRSRAALVVLSSDFAWDRAQIATLRHSTFPWMEEVAREWELDAAPLTSVAFDLGERDRLSLLAQFAAHQAFLQFAGIGDGDFDTAQWAAIRRRGADCRLVRVSAPRVALEAAVAPLISAQRFAEAVRAARLDVLRQPWARAEAIYAECHERLARDAAADLRWATQAAWGEILDPSPEALRRLWSERDVTIENAGPAAAEALAAMAALDDTAVLVAVRGGSILRYGALAELRRTIGPFETLSETAIAERVAALVAERHVIVAVAGVDAIDEPSRRVLQLVSAMRRANWVTIGTRGDAGGCFVISPRLAGAAVLRRRIESAADPRRWVRDFVTSPEFAGYLRDGVVPADAAPAIDLREPDRSYLAALALLGPSIPRTMAEAFLRELLFTRDVRELQVEGVFRAGVDVVEFASDETRALIAALNPAQSRQAICRIAAQAAELHGDLRRAAGLLLEAGDEEAAVALLDRHAWSSAAELLEAVRRVPLQALPAAPRLARAVCEALVRAGRYRDAREVGGLLADDEREIVLAKVERRTGHYAPALARVSRLSRSAESDLLRAELLVVERREEEACAVLAGCVPSTEEERARAAYLHALLDSGLPDDAGDPYYTARLKTYRALAGDDYQTALAHAAESLAAARDVVERIDSRLDAVYTLFTAGRWADARAAAMEALVEVEETQGDRAAGGLLFLLAYLCADDGQWAHAAQRIERLREFYSETHDERRLAEIDLLAAQLEFSRGQFEPALRIASGLLERGCDPPIREAASLIRLEAAWIEGDDDLDSGEAPHNLELLRRYRQIVRRTSRSAVGGSSQSMETFDDALASWERSGDSVPAARSGSEKLKLFRSALGRGKRSRDGRLLELANRIAAEMGIDLDALEERPEKELLVLRAAARREFPYAPSDLEGVSWCFATRNRLGQWQQIGSEALAREEELDTIAASPAGDWIACSDRELLWIEGAEEWSAESRDALAALFHARAELHRLRRLLEQEELSRERTARADDPGIVGSSPAVREVLDRIARVARRDVTVCIRGESGTGKELIARALHRASSRRAKVFTAVNCAALPEQLIESELFGHVRGAFTGADRDRAGLIESTDGGTLFLDEIGEMPLPAQAKLLRFLQEGEFRRVGDAATYTADVRVVTATNRSLESAVEEGRFREDLYYRIRVVEVTLPPLRDRIGDISLLAAHFLASEREKHRGGPSRLSPDVEAIFAVYRWPGNVRELQNTIRAAHALAGDAREIDVEHLPERLRRIVTRGTAGGSYQEAVARFRRELIEKSLAETNGNQNQAAALLQISRQALAYQIRELGIMVRKGERPRLVTER